MWCIPPKAYAELYRDTKGMRWFGVGGCWKTASTDKSDEQLEEERTVEGQEIAFMPSGVFNTWTARQRRDFLCVVCDSDLTRDQVLAHILACGGGIGSPPDPWVGEYLKISA